MTKHEFKICEAVALGLTHYYMGPRHKAARKAWAARNPEKAREVSRHSQAVFVGKRKQKRLGGEHVLALMGITLKVRMVA